jgi:hypothetical protein
VERAGECAQITRVQMFAPVSIARLAHVWRKS